jgi:histidine triad (HIT) family protein
VKAQGRRYVHAPPGYVCPACELVAGRNPAGEATTQADVVYRAPRALAFVSARFWPNNPGHVVVVPTRHYENIFDLSGTAALAVHLLAQRVALAMKDAYACGGISTRQHNEPAGQQTLWHYHVHVFPRYPGDGLYASDSAPTTEEERRPYADALRRSLGAPAAAEG